jgi:hypothetical protein
MEHKISAIVCDSFVSWLDMWLGWSIFNVTALKFGGCGLVVKHGTISVLPVVWSLLFRGINGSKLLSPS